MRFSPGSVSLINLSTAARLLACEAFSSGTARLYIQAAAPPRAVPLVGSAAVLLREIMTASVVTASPEEPVQDLAALMRDRNVGSVVLIDDSGRPVGMVTDRDLAIGPLAEGADPRLPAQDCATAPVVTGESDMDLDEAAALMVSHKIRRLPVLDEGELVGIVTLDDIAVRTGNLEVAQRMTAQVAQAVFPDFYFHMRGG